MTGPHFDTEGAEETETRPISVAELLAKNGTIGSPPPAGRRRRRRGNSDAVTVAELTGEIPVITDEDESQPETDAPDPEPPARQSNGSARVAEAAPWRPTHAAGAEDRIETVNWSEPGPRWPASPPLTTPGPGPQRSAYPLPKRKADESGAEHMSPDPVDDYADMEVDVMDTDVRDVELPAEDSAYVRSFLRAPRALFEKWRRTDESTDDDLDEAEDLDDDHAYLEADLVDDEADAQPESTGAAVLRGGLVVLQSILLAGFGAGMFLAFQKLWQWQHIVALVLAVLVILGLVTAVQVVRKTVDTASTLIAVAVGALIAFGPLALSQTG